MKFNSAMILWVTAMSLGVTPAVVAQDASSQPSGDTNVGCADLVAMEPAGATVFLQGYLQGYYAAGPTTEQQGAAGAGGEVSVIDGVPNVTTASGTKTGLAFDPEAILERCRSTPEPALAEVLDLSPGTPANAAASEAAAPAAQQAGAPAVVTASIEEMLAVGGPVFETNCAGCHASNGRGDIGPNLIGNGRLADPVFVHRKIKQGGDEMPAFGSVLSEEEILAVGTYVRNSWGNTYGPLTPENVTNP